LSSATVTVNCKDFTTLSAGIPVLDASGNAAPTNIGWSVGYFSAGTNFATDSAATLKTEFTIFGSTSTTWFRNGLMNASITASLPANDTSYTGKTIYTVVGDAATIANSTIFAIFSAGVTFPTVDGTGTGLATDVTSVAGNVVYGTLMTPNTQPTGGTFTQGVKMTSVPESSTALLGALGALGLLRRRR